MSASTTPPLLAITGPTAVGKSALAMTLCERLSRNGGPGAEIISVDSAQVYRGMDIGTAKPDAEARAQVPHHLLDLVDPAEPYSAARFAADARVAIAAIRARGRIPLLVGGTMLYFRALFEGLSALPVADRGFRAQLAAEAEVSGWPALHARLARLNPAAAARLHPNDAQRIQRALEIVEFANTVSRMSPEMNEGLDRPLESCLRFVIAPPQRAALGERIARRLDKMMEAGFLNEVRALHGRGDLGTELPAIRAVGYRQIWLHLEGMTTLDEALQEIRAATRQYAKRQMTWLRGEAKRWPEKWVWIDVAEPGTVARVLTSLTERAQ